MGIHIRFSLRTLFVVVAAAGIAAGFIARSMYWIHERDALISLIWTDDHPIMGYVEAGADGPPKSMPVLWRLVGATQYSQITVRSKVEESLFQRFIAAFPEADVRRNASWVEFIDIQKVENQPTTPNSNHGLEGGSF